MDRATFAERVRAGDLEPCEDFLDGVPHEPHTWMWVNPKTGRPSTGLRCPGCPDDKEA